MRRDGEKEGAGTRRDGREDNDSNSAKGAEGREGGEVDSAKTTLPQKRVGKKQKDTKKATKGCTHQSGAPNEIEKTTNKGQNENQRA